MTRLSQLDGLRVYGEDGKALGRVWDLRTESRAAAAEGAHRDLAALVVGRAGLLERMGIKRPGPDRIPCDRIVELGPERVIVRR
jgi:sporulation protein YlmC with PRC-barrel domain